MNPTCTHCNSPLKHSTGREVIRLYRCEKCGTQVMLPGEPAGASAAAPAAVISTVAASTTPAAAVIDEVAAPAPAPKKGWLSKIFGS